jgi:hypothetical protein
VRDQNVIECRIDERIVVMKLFVVTGDGEQEFFVGEIGDEDIKRIDQFADLMKGSYNKPTWETRRKDFFDSLPDRLGIDVKQIKVERVFRI